MRWGVILLHINKYQERERERERESTTATHPLHSHYHYTTTAFFCNGFIWCFLMVVYIVVVIVVHCCRGDDATQVYIYHRITIIISSTLLFFWWWWMVWRWYEMKTEKKKNFYGPLAHPIHNPSKQQNAPPSSSPPLSLFFKACFTAYI